MSDRLRVRLEQAAADGQGILFLSAHLDDAVLSCGALASTLARAMPLTVATVFTAAGPPPHTRTAQAFLRQCKANNAEGLFAARRQEDVDVLSDLGVEHLHLGVPDALFRRRETRPATAALGRVLPEAVHRYPTFRFDIDKGRVARGDRALVDRLNDELSRVLNRIDAGLVFAPVGVGRHVDHLLTRSLGARCPRRVVYYSDFPYDQRHLPDPAFLAAHRLEAVTWGEGVDRKPDLIRGYRTQAAALFPSGNIPVVRETYYVPT